MAATYHAIDPYLREEYHAQGHRVKLGNGVEVYMVGQKDGGRGIILLPDSGGWHSGRILSMADYLSANGYYLAIPHISPHESSSSLSSSILNAFTSHNISQTSFFEEHFLPTIMELIEYMHERMVSELNLLAFGWSTIFAGELLSRNTTSHYFRCAVLVHPCLHLRNGWQQGSVHDPAKNIAKPIMFVLAQNDANEYLEGGAFFEPLKYRLPSTAAIEFPYLTEGFILHGPIECARVHDSIKSCFDKILEFMHDHH